MQKFFLLTLGAGLLFVTGVALAQTKEPVPAAVKAGAPLEFEVASVKPAAPIDVQKLAAAMQNGGKMPIGARVDGSQATYTYVALRELIALAYKLKPYQITGPDWLPNQRFDIIAKLPEGATKDDVPRMMQALLADRFKMTFHKENKDHPVLALVVGKGGPKLEPSTEKPKAIDESVPLKAGEMSMDTGEGPARMSMNADKMGATIDLGEKGKIKYHLDPTTMTLHMDADQVSMSGFADMLTQFSQLTGGEGRQVVDMTELKGNYKVAIEFALTDLLAMARAAGVDVPANLGGASNATPGVAASDPSSNSSVFQAVSALGLKLEQRKLPVDQLIIDHIEKTATEN